MADPADPPNALTANKKLWSKTVLFVMYDENDGWFDHVSPPTAPRGTPGEWLTAKTISSLTDGIRGPLGLGVRVPMLVISPFSRGGHVASEVFDHTSQLKFLSERFGVELPNGSKWRRETVGDLTSALFRGKHNASAPHLPKVPLGPSGQHRKLRVRKTSEFGGASPTIPTKQRMPTQHGTTVPAVAYFAESPTAGAGRLRSGREHGDDEVRCQCRWLHGKEEPLSDRADERLSRTALPVHAGQQLDHRLGAAAQ